MYVLDCFIRHCGVQLDPSWAAVSKINLQQYIESYERVLIRWPVPTCF
jgi:hypothetical protein